MNVVIFLNYVLIIVEKLNVKNVVVLKYVLIIVKKSKCKECLADKDNTIPKIEEYSKEEYEVISFLTKK
tara:strand:+ start:138 stop:344 length:207 start_codon:yes stop_codon:yes gene_type:complete